MKMGYAHRTDRRDFLRRLGLGMAGLVAGAELDLERLLWVPKPMITVPAMPGIPASWASWGFQAGDIFTMEGVYVVNPPTRRRALQRFVVTDAVTSDEGALTVGLA